MNIREKWPTHFKATRITTSVIGQELDFYFIAAIVNQNQLKDLKENMQILAEFEVGNDRYAALSILNYNQINQLLQVYEPRSRVWRGQWYALANAVVDGCREALQSLGGETPVMPA
jgi:hypothetical protein